MHRGALWGACPRGTHAQEQKLPEPHANTHLAEKQSTRSTFQHPAGLLRGIAAGKADEQGLTKPTDISCTSTSKLDREVWDLGITSVGKCTLELGRLGHSRSAHNQ